MIAYEGSSMLDGAPIVLILTSTNRNRKTGEMIQSWILRADVSPLEALGSGKDSSVCGGCRHRPQHVGLQKIRKKREGLGGKGGWTGRTCYVIPLIPQGVWFRWQLGEYDGLPVSLGSTPLRIGSYGDPAAVPLEVWDELNPKEWTGYTSLWRGFPGLKKWCMASVSSKEEASQAQSLGWSTFRILKARESLLPGEKWCLATREGGMLKQCRDCLLCNGKGNQQIATRVHGPGKHFFKPEQLFLPLKI